MPETGFPRSDSVASDVVIEAESLRQRSASTKSTRSSSAQALDFGGPSPGSRKNLSRTLVLGAHCWQWFAKAGFCILIEIAALGTEVLHSLEQVQAEAAPGRRSRGELPKQERAGKKK